MTLMLWSVVSVEQMELLRSPTKEDVSIFTREKEHFSKDLDFSKFRERLETEKGNIGPTAADSPLSNRVLDHRITYGTGGSHRVDLRLQLEVEQLIVALG
jgi:hypothetical protein